MKKVLAVLLTLVLVLALPAAALANPGQNPNRNPGSPEVTSGNYTVRVTGGGNNLRIDILRDGVVVYPAVPRAGNGTFSQTFVTTSGHSIFIQVQGNSLRNVTVTPPAAICPADDYPYVVGTEYVWRFYKLGERLDSLFLGALEVVGSRNLTDLIVSSTFVEVNFSHIPDSEATGMGVIAGFVATGTLNFSYIRNYLEQFERIYIQHNYNIMSDGSRIFTGYGETRIDAAAEDGDKYFTTNSGTADVYETGGGVRLVRGHGQGYLRNYAISGPFTVGLYLANQSPRVDVVFIGYDLEAFIVTLPLQ